MKGNNTSFHLVGDELIQGCQPGFHAPASSNAQSSSFLRGAAGAWLHFLQWPQELHKDSWEPSLLIEGLRGPIWSPWGIHIHQTRKDSFEEAYIQSTHFHDSTAQGAHPEGPPEMMPFKQIWDGFQRPRAQVLSGHPCSRILSSQKK